LIDSAAQPSARLLSQNATNEWKTGELMPMVHSVAADIYVAVTMNARDAEPTLIVARGPRFL
jgi:hypothetical protein